MGLRPLASRISEQCTFTHFGSYIDNLPSTPYRPWQTVAEAAGERWPALTTPWLLSNYPQLRQLLYLSPQKYGWITASLAYVGARHSAAWSVAGNSHCRA